ncbi:anti-phage deoxyguanosine triphosphatase [Sphingomonas sp. BK235]|uniref:anti-phage deoxyguanosine triphosphatase n=1 Tax=Sphingomonas sp. BK235 TaxID=2512131 RepID=UPI00104DFAF5|nr:anti-phage deoxyguanosine triphosphatase [Sphingomonas sp. BK235]TCP37555.1 dGTPase [Sphingomonas sp. BK235]
MDWDARPSGWIKSAGDARSNSDIDYGRVIHSASFRRLQGKTQILNLGDSDFYRTRLTHSLEVAQIAGGIVRQVRHDHPDHPVTVHLPDLAMIQAIGATHDLGHPPFGHGGEVALNFCMADHGGFEGNGQTLRILTKLEKFSDAHGADLTRRTLLGTLKYPASYAATAHPALRPRLLDAPSGLALIDREASKPPKCFMESEAAEVAWILAGLSDADRTAFVATDRTEAAALAEIAPRHRRTLHKSLDCSIMDTADDIAFGVHDLEDAAALGLVSATDWEMHVTPGACEGFFTWLGDRGRSRLGNDAYAALMGKLFGDASARKHAVSLLVGFFLHRCVIVQQDAFAEPLLRFRVAIDPAARALLDALKRLVYITVIRSPEVQHLEFKGQRMVVSVFEALASEPAAFLPRNTFRHYAASGGDRRVICDHVAGMTDMFLLKTYERLFSPRMGSVFDRI